MKKWKRLLAVVVVAAVAVSLFSVPVAAGTAGTVRVNTSLLVRSAGNTGATVIGKLYNGAKVTITGGANGWDQIAYNGKTGWISRQYVVTQRAQTAVTAAKSQLGVLYSYGGSTPGKSFDCSGLTMYAYSKAGLNLPHSAAGQAAYGWWVSRSALKPGDLLFFDPNKSGSITHCGIYIGNDQFISAQSGAGKVMVGSLSSSYWSGAYVSARRLTN